MAHAKYVFAAVLLVGLAIFGRRYHWVEAANTAERDAFVDKAELILHGQFPRDPFRPPLYSLLAAGLAPLCGGAFAAARLISNLAACGLALMAFGFGARLGNQRIGLWSMGLTLANANLWIFGEHAATDMLFACFAAGALLAGLEYLGRPSARAALAAGVACALGAWVRGNAALLAPSLLLAYVLAPVRPATARPPGEERAAGTRAAAGGAANAAGRALWHPGLAVAAAVLVLAPLWWLRWRDFGSPFYDENWRNLWWKLHGHFDWSLLERAPRSSFGHIVLGEPAAVVASTLRELAKFVGTVLPSLVGGWWCVPPLVVAAGASIRRRRPDRLYLLFALATFTFGVAAVFFTWGRFMLLWIPIASALSMAECDRLTERLRVPGAGRWVIPASAAASGALVALTLGWTAFWQLPQFVRQHPYAEVAALAPLDEALRPDEALAGTAPFLQRYFKHRYVPLLDQWNTVDVDEDRYWCDIERLLHFGRVKYLAVSDLQLGLRPRGLLGAGDAPARPWLELARRDAHVTLWRVLDVPSVPDGRHFAPCS